MMFNGKPKLSKAVSIVILVLVSFTVYANSLKNDFVWDDATYILVHPFIKDFSNIKYLFSSTYLRDPQKMLGLGMYNVSRPVWVLSAMLDYKLWAAQPFGHHLTNVILHALTVVLLFILLNLLFQDRGLSFLAGLLFALHPIQTEAVNVVSFRPDLLAAVFMLLAFILFIKTLDASGLKAALALSFSLLFYLIANLAKEMAITLPILIAIYLYLFVPKEKLSRNKKIIILYFSLIVLAGAAYLFVRRSHFFYGNINIALPLAQAPLLYRLGVMFLAFVKYIQLLFLPLALCADYDFFFPQRFLSLNVILAGLSLLAILASALMVRRRKPIISFAIFWFFITLFPVSNIIPIVNVMAERYLYIPSAAYCLFLAWAMLKLKERLAQPQQKIALQVLLVFILALYGAGTFARNRDWQSDLSIWRKTVRQCPNNFRGRNNLGRAYALSGRYDEAIKEFQQSIRLEANNYIAHINLGACDQKLGRLYEAKEQYRLALEDKPAYTLASEKLWVVQIGLGNDYLKAGRLDEAMQEYLAAINLNPQFAPVYYNLGNIFLKKELFAEAKEMYEQAIKIDKYYAEAHSNLGVVFAKEGKLQAAKEQWDRAVKFKPGLKSAEENLKRMEQTERGKAGP